MSIGPVTVWGVGVDGQNAPGCRVILSNVTIAITNNILNLPENESVGQVGPWLCARLPGLRGFCK
ncbi:hypothetical protein DSLASN_17920 [Desulfoluna limicola]|uniref:Uncharacterized protein n=1 Tax=Desulfoluna limicola TaxID=2810562 RepID=A0ABN6F3K1_9BACT|nr:hypothetical protein DSLASN_17920 [Desulfoluna limicola]